MNVFFNGPFLGEGGPGEVNRNIVRCLRGEIKIKSGFKHPVLDYGENLFQLFVSKVIVFSGLLYKPYEVNLAKFLNKRIIYIMHGCARIEEGISNAVEDNILEKSDLILCVSEIYRNVMAEYFPQYAHKMEVLTNGVNWAEIEAMKASLSSDLVRDEKRIILFGGGRVTKKNLYTCRAVQQINDEDGTDYHIDVYGYYRCTDDTPEIAAIPCVTFHQIIPHDLVNVELAKSKLFIQNSDFEPFSLAVMDALLSGCDILLSKFVGAQGVIDGKTEMDIIQNPTDVEELKVKIRNVLKKSNNKRLLSSVDRVATSIESATANLLKYCERYV